MLSNQSVKNDKPQDKVTAKSQGQIKLRNGGNSITLSEQKAREELNGSKFRYEKGLELYKQGKVSIGSNGLFKVSGFEVDTGRMKCECPDYKTRRQPCKHIFASLLFVKNRGKQRIENLEGFSNGANSKESISQPESKDASSKLVEGHKDHDRQSIITRL
jgi:hypothetical protein